MRDRIIVFIGSGTQIITREQEAAIFSSEVTKRGSISIDGNYINLSSIARIIGLEEYYREHPNMRPAPKPSDTFLHLTMGQIRKGNVRREALASMIRGLENYIASSRYQGTNKPLELLSVFKSRLAALDNN